MESLAIDIETYSSVELGKSGVYKYAEAEDFEILLFSYAIDDGETKTVDLASGEQIPQYVIDAIHNAKVIKWAFNAQFERVCLSRHLGTWLTPESWRCTMVWAATLGLPLSLEGVGTVLGLERQKMKEGRALIRYFSVPCRPTKSNDGRTRNLPHHAKDKWEQFKEYNARDVDVERDIKGKLKKFPVPETEWQNYILDQQINDEGICLDMTLVIKAIECDDQFRRTHMEKARRLTGLENPNSTQQLKEWLESKGITVDSLSKADVSDLLTEADGDVEKVLQLRQELAKSSVKKYTAMENAVCKDRRAHGLLQFYGANRTGRFAGRLIQVQNLPQNHLPDLKQARELVRHGRFDALEMLYDSVPVVLSELIRTAFVPKKGYRFFVADFSAIEARVIAWLAGERWRQEVFASHGKIYEASASQMFHIPIEEITKGSTLRQKGKVSELACIAEDELVLTNKGLIPIQDITLEHKLWDGENWVTHEGVIFKGYRKVINYDGLRATKDHLVWIQGQCRPVRFEHASASGTHLVQTGNGRQEYGWVKIISPEKRWNATWNHCYVLTQCTGCKRIQWTLLNSLTSGKSKGCQMCSQPKQIPKWLEKRIGAAKQRCQNPKDRNYGNYGAMGIKFNFPSVLEAGLWIIENLENVSREMEMDRIDTNGNYEKGNIRFVPRKINQANRKLTVLKEWNQTEWPYVRSVVTRLLSVGMSREQIICKAKNAVLERRKNWRLIQARLEFMTYEMRDPTTVLPYRECSYITVDTVEELER